MRIFLGVLLIIVACLAMCGIVVIPVLPPLADNASIDNALAVILCKPNERLERDLYQRTDNDGTSYSMTPTCINSERQREDVTVKWVLIGGGAFVIPFLIGLFLTIWGAGRAAKRRIANSLGNPGYNVVNTSGMPASNMEFKDGVLKVGGMQLKMDHLNPENIKAQMGMSAGGGDLTEKLRQLQEAKDNGLISSSEYDRMRQKILDDMK